MKWLAAITVVLALGAVAILAGGVHVSTVDYVTVNVGGPVITSVGQQEEGGQPE